MAPKRKAGGTDKRRSNPKKKPQGKAEGERLAATAVADRVPGETFDRVLARLVHTRNAKRA